MVARLLLCVYILTFLIGVPANILAFCTFLRKLRHKPTPIDILLLNLTISDLLFLTVLPFKMKEAMEGMSWNMDYILCPITGFFFYSTIYNSTLFLTGISVERYLGVAFPFRYSLCRRPRYAAVASVVFWLVSSMNLSIVYIVASFLLEDNPSLLDNNTAPQECSFPPETCYLNFTPKQLSILLPVRLELFLVLFCVPFLICSFCYINFIRILSRMPSIGRRRRLRAIGLALGTLVVFTVSFGPYNVSHVVGFVHMDSEHWRDIALLTSTLNACLDPVIFYFSSAAVRSMLSHGLRSSLAKLHILKCGRDQCCPPLVAPVSDKYKET